MLKFKVTSLRAEELHPGDLFSTAGAIYWNVTRDPQAVGERVYIRTEAPCPADQRNDQLFRVEIEHEAEP